MVAFLAAIASMGLLLGCDTNGNNTTGDRLIAPHGLQLLGSTLTWNTVHDAASYVLEITDTENSLTTEFTLTSNVFNLQEFDAGAFRARVKAVASDNSRFMDSVFSHHADFFIVDAYAPEFSRIDSSNPYDERIVFDERNIDQRARRNSHFINVYNEQNQIVYAGEINQDDEIFANPYVSIRAAGIFTRNTFEGRNISAEGTYRLYVISRNAYYEHTFVRGGQRSEPFIFEVDSLAIPQVKREGSRLVWDKVQGQHYFIRNVTSEWWQDINRFRDGVVDIASCFDLQGLAHGTNYFTVRAASHRNLDRFDFGVTSSIGQNGRVVFTRGSDFSKPVAIEVKRIALNTPQYVRFDSAGILRWNLVEHASEFNIQVRGEKTGGIGATAYTNYLNLTSIAQHWWLNSFSSIPSNLSVTVRAGQPSVATREYESGVLTVIESSGESLPIAARMERENAPTDIEYYDRWGDGGGYALYWEAAWRGVDFNRFRIYAFCEDGYQIGGHREVNAFFLIPPWTGIFYVQIIAIGGRHVLIEGVNVFMVNSVPTEKVRIYRPFIMPRPSHVRLESSHFTIGYIGITENTGYLQWFTMPHFYHEIELNGKIVATNLYGERFFIGNLTAGEHTIRIRTLPHSDIVLSVISEWSAPFVFRVYHHTAATNLSVDTVWGGRVLWDYDTATLWPFFDLELNGERWTHAVGSNWQIFDFIEHNNLSVGVFQFRLRRSLGSANNILRISVWSEMFEFEIRELPQGHTGDRIFIEGSRVIVLM
ncbi:MAG: hypothetical protein FWC82_00885 [Firmicutes bacterium]|nr:hypothetical protein [Bacillota bacterium]